MLQPSHLNPDQLKKIQTMRRKMGMTDEDYRGMLRDNFNLTSSKDLTFSQARDLIDGLERRAGGVMKNPPGKKFEYLGTRPGMAVPAQLRMIEAMWKDVSVNKDPKKREEALKAFLSSRFQVANIEWMEAKQVQKVVRALKAMKYQKAEAAKKEAA